MLNFKIPALALALVTSIVTCLAITPVATADEAPLPSALSNPKVYVFPLKGQMGTDISEPLFKMIIEDVKKQKPDILILKLTSADIDKNDYLRNDDRDEFGLVGEITNYRDMVKSIHDDLSNIPQVMWVEDSVGVSGLMALSWSRMYMGSGARLMGISQFKEMVEKQWDDADVRSKMVAAWTGIMKGLVQLGGYPDQLADAMIFSDRMLSLNFEGRGVKWLADTSGTWVLDSSKDAPVNFQAQIAEDTLLSDGTADTLDDLMFLLGYRDFVKVDSGEKIAKQYTDDWRKAMKNVQEWLKDAGEVDDSLIGLGKRKSFFEKIVSALKQYPVIEKRRELGGINRLQLENEIDNIKKQIQKMRDAGKNNGGGGGGGGGGGKGLGGGGMGRPKGN